MGVATPGRRVSGCDRGVGGLCGGCLERKSPGHRPRERISRGLAQGVRGFGGRTGGAVESSASGEVEASSR